jgi:hypothetical protein
MVEKLLLRTSTLRSKMSHVNHLLEQKEERGENLHPIDFEQLKIENSRFLEKIDHKNRNLLKMKKMAGLCLAEHNLPFHAVQSTLALNYFKFLSIPYPYAQSETIISGMNLQYWCFLKCCGMYGEERVS